MFCLLNELPPLTILVVGETSGLPGTGFIAAEDIPKTQQEVFSFDWINHGAPSPEKFQDAVIKLPSNGK